MNASRPMHIKNLSIDSRDATVWVAEAYLLARCKGLTAQYLAQFGRYNFSKGVGKSWCFKRENAIFYYDYDSIPDKAPTHYKSQLPSRDELMVEWAKSQKAVQEAPQLSAAIDKALTVDYIKLCPNYADNPEQMIALAKAAAVLLAGLDWIEDNGVSVKGQAFFIEFGHLIAKKEVRYLPSNDRRLKEKILELRGDIAQNVQGMAVTDVVKMPRSGNSNATTAAGDDEITAWALILRGLPQNFTNAHIIRKVRLMCDLNGKKVPSESWFSTLLAKAETKALTSAGRHGSGRHGQRYAAYNPIERALFAGDCWQMDGSRVNMVGWKSKDAATGKWSEKFLYIVVVRDVHSGAILGCSFGLTESRYQYAAALSMAVQNTGYLPYELVTDRFPGHNTEEWKLTTTRLQRLGVKMTITSAATGKASLERWFSTLQTVFLQNSLYYYGEGIRSARPFAHREASYLLKIKQLANKDGWDAGKAIDEAERCLWAYNTTKLCEYSRKFKKVELSPNEIHEASEKSGAKVLDWQIPYAVGLQKEIQVRNGMIITEIQTVSYTYLLPAKIADLYPSVLMSYDLENLDKVWLFDVKTEKYLGEAVKMSRIQVYGAAANFDDLSRHKSELKARQTARKEKFEALTQAGDMDEVTLLLAGKLPKAAVEAAETAALLERDMNVAPLEKGTPQYNSDFDADDEDEFDAAAFRRNAY